MIFGEQDHPDQGARAIRVSGSVPECHESFDIQPDEQQHNRIQSAASDVRTIDGRTDGSAED